MGERDDNARRRHREKLRDMLQMFELGYFNFSCLCITHFSFHGFHLLYIIFFRVALKPLDTITYPLSIDTLTAADVNIQYAAVSPWLNSLWDKVTGKALMLDEIINYVQSLQNQVEFLSMKIASVNPMLYDFGMDLDAFMVKSEVQNQSSSLEATQQPFCELRLAS
ncbi:hypothetical protein POM88_045134 [Heracleum sosnowskyi]|uniref:Uncharacterized protein n=1 Tax=Heracleum sosnowskyi TaxID=360622 RepID=A0AAD8M3I3_9APIA|nr:hypothetical protein POM88_045134 [Heracleum sosnowskyi]